jgi:hypothetical protein
VRSRHGSQRPSAVRRAQLPKFAFSSGPGSQARLFSPTQPPCGEQPRGGVVYGRTRRSPRGWRACGDGARGRLRSREHPDRVTQPGNGVLRPAPGGVLSANAERARKVVNAGTSTGRPPDDVSWTSLSHGASSLLWDGGDARESRGERKERRSGRPLPWATRPGFDLATGLRTSGVQLPRSGFVRRSCECCWGPTRSSVASPGSSALLQLRTSGLARAFCSPWAQERIALGLVRRQGY